MADLVNIKQIQLSDGLHDIDAKYWNGHEWSELGNPLRFLGAAQSEVPTAGRYVKASVETHPDTEHWETYYIPVTTEGAATEISAEKGDVFIIPSAGVEYLCIGAGTYPNAEWTCLGDETNFQQIGKTLTTSTPSTNTTSEAAAQNLTTSNATNGTELDYTATGTATGILNYYNDTATETGEAALADVSTVSYTGQAGGATINGSDFGFSGTKKTLTGTFTVNGIAMADHAAQTLTVSGSQSVAAHSHGINFTKNTVSVVLANGRTKTDGMHDHTGTVNSHVHGDDVSASKITGYTAPSMTPINFTANTTQSLTTKNYGFSAEQTVLASAQVSTLGVLSFGTVTAGTQDALSAGSAASLTGGVFSAGTLAYSGVTAAGTGSAATLDLYINEGGGAHYHEFLAESETEISYVTGATLDTAGAATIDGSNFKAALPSLTHTQSGTASVNVSIDYTPAGSITGSKTIAEHSHSYSAPKAHKHSITMESKLSTIDASLSAGVSILKHTHSVTVAAHTHDMGNHTHNVTTTNN